MPTETKQIPTGFILNKEKEINLNNGPERPISKYNPNLTYSNKSPDIMGGSPTGNRRRRKRQGSTRKRQRSTRKRH